MSDYHFVKLVQPFFRDVREGKKTFELRKEDRDYKVGDYLVLEEYDPQTKLYQGREINTRITYILSSEYSRYGIKPGFCILGIEIIPQEDVA